MMDGWKLGYGWSGMVLVAGLLVVATTGCSDDVAAGAEECAADEEWNPIDEVCVPAGVADNQSPNDSTGDEDAGGDPGEEDTGNGQDPGDTGDPGDPDCVALECGPENCDPAEGLGTVSGVVTIPSGELPLPDVTVYVPDGGLDGLDEVTAGASCVQCEDELSGDPVVDTTTDVDGVFELHGVDAGSDIPLVVEVGKWRRTTTVDSVSTCEETAVAPEQTRLPSNRNEGEMPQIAVTTGECDALGCLIRKIGIDDDEITTDDGDGAVHLFTGRTANDDEAEGPTDRFADNFNNGEEFTMAEDWWIDADNLLDYDVMLNACECSPISKSADAHDAFSQFTDAGGRAFLTHLHYPWLSDGSSDMQSVANWNMIGGAPGGFDQTATGYINIDFPKGLMLRDWLYNLGTTPAGEFDIHHVRGSVDSIDEDIAQDWISVEGDGGFFDFGSQDEYIQYFSFNTPVSVDEDDQCGRVVFSDIHVSGRDMSDTQDVSGPDYPFPQGCQTNDLSDQEKALVFMLFDLSACIIPDGVKKGDW